VIWAILHYRVMGDVYVELGVVFMWFWALLQSFARYSDLMVENREIFIPHLYLAAPHGMTPSEFREDV